MRQRGQLQSEDHFTSRLIDRIATRIDDLHTGGIRWTAIETVSQGAHSQERATGADLLGVLRIKTPSTSLAKGFLAQAKIVRRGMDLDDLSRQCEDMLRVTPDAYAWLYHEDGVWVAPAIAIASADPPSLLGVDLRSLGAFFDLHLRSWVGDQSLGAATREELEAIRREFRAERALMLEATPAVEA
jgi:hypothetical protein